MCYEKERERERPNEDKLKSQKDITTNEHTQNDHSGKISTDEH